VSAADEAERTMISRAAAYAQWAAEPDWTARTAKLRAGFNKRFDDQVIAMHGELPLGEHAKRAEALRKAYFSNLARKSAAARRARKKS
jgi:hypothetical protein